MGEMHGETEMRAARVIYLGVRGVLPCDHPSGNIETRRNSRVRRSCHCHRLGGSHDGMHEFAHELFRVASSLK